MRLTTKMVLVSLGLGAGVATAQPTEPGPGTTDVSPTPPPQPPPPQPPPPQPQPPPVEHTVVAPRDNGNSVRPTELAFAIGIGYSRPTTGSIDLQTPNIASARLRLISGITFEPTVVIGNTNQDNSANMMDMSETTTQLDLATLVRFPVIRHNHVDFEVLGSIGLDVVKDDPPGDFNTKTTTGFALGWGIGIGYWFSPHWQLSVSETNPVLTYDQTRTQTGPDSSADQKTSTTTFAVQFNPTTIVMLHLYN
jgi:hypothetical protein